MTKMFIPELGTKLVLTKDWTFTVYWGNNPFMGLFNLDKDGNWIEPELCGWEKYVESTYTSWDGTSRDSYNWRRPFTFPATTILTVDRIYIRKGKKNYSSVTFTFVTPILELTLASKGGTMPKYSQRRFWAKLEDVNNIEFEIGEPEAPKSKGRASKVA